MTVRRMARGAFVYLLLLTCAVGTARAAEINGTCNDHIASSGQCVDWMARSLKTLGCSMTNPTCARHVWGSDFSKSWICTTQSSNCGLFPEAGCAAGTTHVFKDGWNLCKSSELTPLKFVGECRHQNAMHGIRIKTCDEGAATCAAFGGNPKSFSADCSKGVLSQATRVGEVPRCEDVKSKCSSMGGTILGELYVACSFRIMTVTLRGDSCEALRKHCEEGNSPEGANGLLESCTTN